MATSIATRGEVGTDSWPGTTPAPNWLLTKVPIKSYWSDQTQKYSCTSTPPSSWSSSIPSTTYSCQTPMLSCTRSLFVFSRACSVVMLRVWAPLISSVLTMSMTCVGSISQRKDSVWSRTMIRTMGSI